MAKKTNRPHSINILFIGNSFTQRNNLPGLLAEMAAARDLCVKHELISAGGASLRTHWNAGVAAKAIATGGYDYVVLQEQSTLPVKNANRMAESIRLFDESIKRAGSKTVLYMTWARQDAPESQKAIADAYNSVGEELGAIVIPVSLIWQNFLSNYDKPVLHDRDQSHPTLAGSYLAACVFLVALLKTKPLVVESGPAGLAAVVRSWWLGRVAVNLIIDAAVAEIKYTQQRNALARQCHARTTRKKLAALGVRLSELPR